MNSTGEVAATSVAAGEGAVASAKAAMTAGKTSVTAPAVTSATLCPERYGEEKSERRDENQAAHTELL